MCKRKSSEVRSFWSAPQIESVGTLSRVIKVYRKLGGWAFSFPELRSFWSAAGRAADQKDRSSGMDDEWAAGLVELFTFLPFGIFHCF